jgi:hypothetical protein
MAARRWAGWWVSSALVLALLTMGGGATLLASSSPAAAASCTPGSPSSTIGTDIFPGSCWLGGNGVNVYSNGASDGSGQYQCTDLVVRLYQAEGWISGSWPSANGDQMWDTHPSNLSDQANGQITYLNPGDAVSMEVKEPNGTDESGGHVAVVNTVTAIGAGTMRCNS